MSGTGATPSAPDPSTWTLPKLRIGLDGEWLDDGEEVTHEGILASFRASLAVDEQGHYVQVGPARVPVHVDDAPFVIVRAEPEDDGLVLILNDLSREPLDVQTLAIDERGVPHCRVKQGRFLARWSRAATYQLLERVESDESGGGDTLVLGGVRHPLGRRAGAGAEPR